MNWWIAGFGLFWCTGGLLLSIKAYRLHFHGLNAQGRVVHQEAQPHFQTSSTIEFVDQDGRLVTFKTIKSAPNKRVLVVYLPHKPNVAEVANGLFGSFFFGVLSMAIGAYFLMLFFRELISG